MDELLARFFGEHYALAVPAVASEADTEAETEADTEADAEADAADASGAAIAADASGAAIAADAEAWSSEASNATSFVSRS